MILSFTTLFCGGLTVLSLAWVAILFNRDERMAFEASGHSPDLLPKVMAGRYAAMSLMVLLALFYGDFRVLAGLFAILSLTALADILIYLRAGRSTKKHLQAGAFAVLFLAVTLGAIATTKGA